MTLVWVLVRWCSAVEIIPRSLIISSIMDRNWCHQHTIWQEWICFFMAYFQKISTFEMVILWMQTGQRMKKPSLMSLPWTRLTQQNGLQQKVLSRTNDLWIMAESLLRNQRQIMHSCFMVFIIWNRPERWRLYCHMEFCFEVPQKEQLEKHCLTMDLFMQLSVFPQICFIIRQFRPALLSWKNIEMEETYCL